MIWDGFAVSTAGWNGIAFGTTLRGLAGTSFRLVPLCGGSLEPHSASYHSAGARWNLIPLRTTVSALNPWYQTE